MHRAILPRVVLGLLVAGCTPTRQEHLQMISASVQGAALLKSEALLMALTPWSMGNVNIEAEPAGARIYIDEGELDKGELSFMIPPAAYEFKAVWPDGAIATKRIFVRPFLGGLESHIAPTTENGQAGFKIVYDKYETHLTNVRLVHP